MYCRDDDEIDVDVVDRVPGVAGVSGVGVVIVDRCRVVGFYVVVIVVVFSIVVVVTIMVVAACYVTVYVCVVFGVRIPIFQIRPRTANIYNVPPTL